MISILDLGITGQNFSLHLVEIEGTDCCVLQCHNLTSWLMIEVVPAAVYKNKFDYIKGRALGAISCDRPLKLDYSPDEMVETRSSINTTLSKSLDEVAHLWWVPSCYEALAEILQRVARQKTSNHKLPILTKNELIEASSDHSPGSSLLLARIKTDAQRYCSEQYTIWKLLAMSCWLATNGFWRIQ